jgi:hypothetical protein
MAQLPLCSTAENCFDYYISSIDNSNFLFFDPQKLEIKASSQRAFDRPGGKPSHRLIVVYQPLTVSMQCVRELLRLRGQAGQASLSLASWLSRPLALAAHVESPGRYN